MENVTSLSARIQRAASNEEKKQVREREKMTVNQCHTWNEQISNTEQLTLKKCFNTPEREKEKENVINKNTQT